MGTVWQAKCNACGNEFTCESGGGFLLHQLRCDTCGVEGVIGFDELHDLQQRRLKGLPADCLTPDEIEDLKDFTGEPISDEQYYAAVEAEFSRCKCGGTYRFDAPPRCPACRSVDISDGKVIAHHD